MLANFLLSFYIITTASTNHMAAFLYNITTYKYINTRPYLEHQYSKFLHVIYNINN